MIRKRLGGAKREAKRRTVPVSKRPKDEQKKKRGACPLYSIKPTRTTRTFGGSKHARRCRDGWR
jgi:hypothetical protein